MGMSLIVGHIRDRARERGDFRKMRTQILHVNSILVRKTVHYHRGFILVAVE